MASVIDEALGEMKLFEGAPIVEEEAFLIRSGAGRYMIGNAALHHNKGPNSDKTWRSMVAYQAEKDRALINRREELRDEYERRIEAGEFRRANRIERLLIRAHGHEDLQATHAARRLLQKRGIDWAQYTEKLRGIERDCA